jgi:hypothetical protein
MKVNAIIVPRHSADARHSYASIAGDESTIIENAIKSHEEQQTPKRAEIIRFGNGCTLAARLAPFFWLRAERVVGQNAVSVF